MVKRIGYRINVSSPQNSTAKGMFSPLVVGYCCAVSEENPFENYLLFPIVEEKDAFQEQVPALDHFCVITSKEDQRAFEDLPQRTEKQFSISYLAPRQSPFEYLLLAMLIEIHKETEKIKDEIEWKLKDMDRIKSI